MATDSRIDRLEVEVQTLRTEMNSRLNSIENRLNSLENRMTTIWVGMMGTMVAGFVTLFVAILLRG